MTPHRSAICKGCWQQLHLPIPLRGLVSAPFRLVGVRPSRMNPNTCTVCEMMFTRIMKANKVTIDASVMFVDLRGYTGLTQSLSPESMSTLLGTFYDECADAIWAHDGLLNKTIGDAVMAVFNFPIRHDDHARNAVLAARDIQRRFADRGAAILRSHGLSDDAPGIGIGIGIDAGTASFGEFGHSHRDLTAIGTVVNMAARAQGAAAAGEILVTRAVYDRTQPDLAASRSGRYSLKGFEEPVELYAA